MVLYSTEVLIGVCMGMDALRNFEIVVRLTRLRQLQSEALGCIDTHSESSSLSSGLQMILIQAMSFGRLPSTIDEAHPSWNKGILQPRPPLFRIRIMFSGMLCGT